MAAKGIVSSATHNWHSDKSKYLDHYFKKVFNMTVCQGEFKGVQLWDFICTEMGVTHNPPSYTLKVHKIIYMAKFLYWQYDHC